MKKSNDPLSVASDQLPGAIESQPTHAQVPQVSRSGLTSILTLPRSWVEGPLSFSESVLWWGSPPFVARWSQDEIAVLGTYTDRAVAEKIGRTLEAVATQRSFLGIPAFQAVKSLMESSSGEPSVDPTRG